MATNLAQILPKNFRDSSLYHACTNFQEMQEPPQNSSRHKEDMKQVPY